MKKKVNMKNTTYEHRREYSHIARERLI